MANIPLAPCTSRTSWSPTCPASLPSTKSASATPWVRSGPPGRDCSSAMCSSLVPSQRSYSANAALRVSRGTNAKGPGIAPGPFVFRVTETDLEVAEVMRYTHPNRVHVYVRKVRVAENKRIVREGASTGRRLNICDLGGRYQVLILESCVAIFRLERPARRNLSFPAGSDCAAVQSK